MSYQTSKGDEMRIDIEEMDIERIASKICSMLTSIVPADKTNSIIMDVEELAQLLKVDKSWVYKQVQFKSIPHFHAGKYPRFKRKEIDDWIYQQSVPSTCPAYPKLKSKQ